MSRTLIATQVPVGPYPAGGTVAALALDLTWTAADASNFNEFVFSGKEVLLAWNTDTAAHTITLHSVADARGRSDDITAYSMAAADIACFDFRNGSEGWLQSDGHVYIDANSALVKFAILTVA